MLSTMSATIVSLRLIDIALVSIHGWTNTRKGEEGMQIRFGKDPNVGIQELLGVLNIRFGERMAERHGRRSNRRTREGNAQL